MNINKNLIFDLGFHSGQDTNFYLKKGFNVIAIEANPILIDENKGKFKKELANNRLKILNYGIGFDNKTQEFYVNLKNSQWSTFDSKLGTSRGAFEIINVEVVTLDKIIDAYGMPYYLKIDIESYDYAAIVALKRYDFKPNYLSTENSHSESIEEIYSLGYRKFKFINQGKIKSIKLPFWAKEGKKVWHKFEQGSSGPFGEETPGKWLNKSEVIELSKSYWNNPERNANIHGWYDLHASF